MDTGSPRISLHVNWIGTSSPTCGIPIELRNSNVLPSRPVSSQVFNPAPVRTTTESRSLSEQYQAATHRVPLPEISASEPSAFNKRTSRSASAAGRTHSTPSAPTPLRRSQICWLNLGMSPGPCAKSIMRKSLPQAVALTKGTVAISVLFGDRCVSDDRDLRKFVQPFGQYSLL